MTDDEEFFSAFRALEEADEIPLERLDESERLGKDAIRRMMRVPGFDARSMITGRAKAIETARNYIRFHNLWAHISMGIFVGSLAGLALSPSFNQAGVVCLTGVFALKIRYDRRKALRGPSVCRHVPVPVPYK